MDKKNILIVCGGFFPHNSPRSFRATELAKEFALQGHKVVVLTPKDEKIHSMFEKEHNLVIRDLGTPKWKSPDLGKSKVGYLLTRIFTRLLSLAFEYPDIELMFLTARALKKERNHDILISIAVPYPIHWGVAKVWKKDQIIAKTWIADCGDPYVGNKTDSFRKWFYWSWVEKWFMNKADFVTIPVESARSAYFTEFHNKIHIIPQGFKIENNKNTEYKPNPIPTFAYAGVFIPGLRDPKDFLEYLTNIEDNFRFYVYTKNPKLVFNYKNKLNEKLIISEYIPREELINKLSSMDFLVNFDNNTTTAVPSKLIDYTIIGRPVINITNVLDKETIQGFLSGDYKSEMNLPNIDQYKIENVCQAFLSLHDAENE